MCVPFFVFPPDVQSTPVLVLFFSLHPKQAKHTACYAKERIKERKAEYHSIVVSETAVGELVQRSTDVIGRAVSARVSRLTLPLPLPLAYRQKKLSGSVRAGPGRNAFS